MRKKFEELNYDRLRTERKLKDLSKKLEFRYLQKPKLKVSKSPTKYRMTNGQNSHRELYQEKFEIMPTYSERLTNLPKLKNSERSQSFMLMSKMKD